MTHNIRCIAIQSHRDTFANVGLRVSLQDVVLQLLIAFLVPEVFEGLDEQGSPKKQATLLPRNPRNPCEVRVKDLGPLKVKEAGQYLMGQKHAHRDLLPWSLHSSLPHGRPTPIYVYVLSACANTDADKLHLVLETSYDQMRPQIKDRSHVRQTHICSYNTWFQEEWLVDLR